MSVHLFLLTYITGTQDLLDLHICYWDFASPAWCNTAQHPSLAHRDMPEMKFWSLVLRCKRGPAHWPFAVWGPTSPSVCGTSTWDPQGTKPDPGKASKVRGKLVEELEPLTACMQAQWGTSFGIMMEEQVF